MSFPRHSEPLASWLTQKPLRFYAIVLVFASLPLAVFLIAAHEILVRQITSRLVTQSSQSGKLVGGILDQHLYESTAALQSFAGRQDLVQDAAGGRWERLGRHLEQAQMLRPDFSTLAIYDLSATLQSTHPPNLTKLGSSGKAQPWYRGVKGTTKPHVSAVFQSVLHAQHGWVIAIAVPLLDNKGAVVGYLVGEQTLEDVTKKIYGLTRSNTTSIAFVDQQGTAFGRQDKAVTVFQAPPQVIELIQKPPSSKGSFLVIDGKEFLVAYTPIESLRWGTLIQVPMSTIQAALWAYEKNILVLALVVLAFILGGSGFVASLYRRIARQKQELAARNQEIERSSQRKSRFLANMSHELRTPLNAILGFTELMRESGRLDSKHQRWNGHVRQAGAHLLELVNDILDLSKIEAGQLELHRESFAVEGAIPEVASVLEAIAHAKGISPDIRVEPGLCLHADRMRFKQILYNLMSNAIKFTPTGGMVGLRAFADGQAVIVSVSDSGTGIAQEDQALIFEEFEQVGDGAAGGQGTGLGLTITKKLVEQHGGSISVASERGKGSLFTLVLPRDPNPRNAAMSA